MLVRSRASQSLYRSSLPLPTSCGDSYPRHHPLMGQSLRLLPEHSWQQLTPYRNRPRSSRCYVPGWREYSSFPLLLVVSVAAARVASWALATASPPSLPPLPAVVPRSACESSEEGATRPASASSAWGCEIKLSRTKTIDTFTPSWQPWQPSSRRSSFDGRYDDQPGERRRERCAARRRRSSCWRPPGWFPTAGPGRPS